MDGQKAIVFLISILNRSEVLYFYYFRMCTIPKITKVTIWILNVISLARLIQINL